MRIGTISIGGVWEATFSMKILQPGNIEILGSNSGVGFSDGSQILLPNTYITALPNSSVGGIGGVGIWVQNVRRTDPGTDPDYADIAWNLTYTGLAPSITEEVDLQLAGSTTWIPYLTKVVNSNTISDSATLDTSGLSSGLWYVRVTASASDTGADSGTTQLVIERGEGTPKIKIA